jgi:hypothetical protein
MNSHFEDLDKAQHEHFAVVGFNMNKNEHQNALLAGKGFGEYSNEQTLQVEQGDPAVAIHECLATTEMLTTDLQEFANSWRSQSNIQTLDMSDAYVSVRMSLLQLCRCIDQVYKLPRAKDLLRVLGPTEQEADRREHVEGGPLSVRADLQPLDARQYTRDMSTACPKADRVFQDWTTLDIPSLRPAHTTMKYIAETKWKTDEGRAKKSKR